MMLASRPAEIRLAVSRRLSIAGPPSVRLTARSSDPGVMSPAVSRSCRQTQPPELRWAVLLFTPKPLAVVCGREQAEALYRWLDSLSTPLETSVVCDRRRPHVDAGPPAAEPGSAQL